MQNNKSRKVETVNFKHDSEEQLVEGSLEDKVLGQMKANLKDSESVEEEKCGKNLTLTKRHSRRSKSSKRHNDRKKKRSVWQRFSSLCRFDKCSTINTDVD